MSGESRAVGALVTNRVNQTPRHDHFLPECTQTLLVYMCFFGFFGTRMLMKDRYSCGSHSSFSLFHIIHILLELEP